MTTQIQRRRGTTAQHSTFTGAVGEVTVDTDKEVLVVHDGAQVGGYPQMRENGSNSALALGSAGTPSLKFTGDTNTGIYSPGADQVAISTGGTGRLFVDASGNVGIGKTPAWSLDVAGQVQVTNNSYYRALNTTGGSVALIGLGADNNIYIGQASTGFTSFFANGSERLRITSAGLVGIGDSAPVSTLTVRGTGGSIAGINTHVLVSDSTAMATGVGGSILFEGAYSTGGDRAVYAAIAGTKENGTNFNYAGNLKFYTRSGSALPSVAMTIDSSQRVGIGTTSPGSTLDVQAATGIVKVSSTTGTNTSYFQASNTGSNFYIGKDNSTGTNFGSAYAAVLWNEGNNPLVFATNSTQRAQIDASGRLLVGTSSGPAGSTVVFSGNSFDGSTGDGRLYLNRGSAPANAEQLGATIFSSNNGANEGASLRAVRDGGTWTAGSSHPTRLVFSTTADGASSPTERMRIQQNGFVKFANNGNYVSTTDAVHRFESDNASNPYLVLRAQNAGYSGEGLQIRVNRAANSAYWFLAGQSSDGGDNEFVLKGDGNAFADGSWSGGGADYAEYFEWSDSNSNEEDRRGISVVLDGDKIREAQPGEDPIGVISGNPSVVGDAAWNKWNGKYLRDEFGTYILEDYEVTDDDGNTVTQQRRKLNPAYDPDVEYISREQRPEWDCVGLMGKLRICKGQVTGSRWVKMRDISDSVEEWLVR